MGEIEGKAIVYSGYGDPKKHLRAIKFKVPEPKDNEVVLKLMACPINPSDLNQVQGSYLALPPMTNELDPEIACAVGGNEAAFEVIKVGKDVKKFKVGDWALPTRGNFGTWRTHAIAHEDQMNLLKDHAGITPVQAATVSVNLATAHRLLTKFADMKPGDWFIQNAGNSGVCRAATQLGKLWGYKSISVVRKRPDFEQLKADLIAVGADKVVTEDDIAQPEFTKTVENWIGEAPLKLALNCVGGESCLNIASQLSEDGHLVTYGSMSKKPIMIPVGKTVFKNVTSHGCWLSGWAAKHPHDRYLLVLELLKLVAEGKIKDVPNTQHTWTEGQSPEEFEKTYFEALDANLSGKGKQIFIMK